MKKSTLVIILLCSLWLIDLIFDVPSDTFIYFFVSFVFFWLYFAILDALDRYEPIQVTQIALLDRDDIAKIVDENMKSKI
jgi:hypothetical protein